MYARVVLIAEGLARLREIMIFLRRCASWGIDHVREDLFSTVSS